MPRVTTAGFSSVSSHFSDTVAVTSWSFFVEVLGLGRGADGEERREPWELNELRGDAGGGTEGRSVFGGRLGRSRARGSSTSVINSGEGAEGNNKTRSRFVGSWGDAGAAYRRRGP